MLFILWFCLQMDQHHHRMHIPAPRMKLPSHSESYNPPPEYLSTEEEVHAMLPCLSGCEYTLCTLQAKEWQEQEPEDRNQNFLPHRYHCSLFVYHLRELYVNISSYLTLPASLYVCPPLPCLPTLQIRVAKESSSLPPVYTGTIWTLPRPVSLSKAEKNASMLNYENLISLLLDNFISVEGPSWSCRSDSQTTTTLWPSPLPHHTNNSMSILVLASPLFVQWTSIIM